MDLVSAKMKHPQDLAVGSSHPKKTKHNRINTKAGTTKKLKRYNPYEPQLNQHEDLDETQLMDTPILEAEEAGKWAMLACPKKPPSDK